MTPPVLAPDQIAEFNELGFVRLGRVLTDAQLDALRAEEAGFRAARHIPAQQEGRTHFFTQVAAYAPAVREVLLNGAHIAAVQQLVSPDLVGWFTQFVTKFPDGGFQKSEFPWHQDNGFVNVEPATNVTVWIPLDDVDEENGCVWVVPGSHKQGLIPHVAPADSPWALTVKVEGDGQSVPMKAGEAVAFTGLTLHRSKYNRTDRIRRAFFMEYCDANSMVERKNERAEVTGIVPVISVENSWVVRGAARLPANF